MKIQCKLGPAETSVFGQLYIFGRDRFDRYVAEVHNPDHAACLLSVEHYIEIGDEPAPVPPPVVPTETPIGLGAGADQAPVSPPPTFDDDIIRIKGIGESLKAILLDYGLTSLVQLAAWTPDDVAKADAELKLHGRIERDKWIEQAKALVPAPVEG